MNEPSGNYTSSKPSGEVVVDNPLEVTVGGNETEGNLVTEIQEEEYDDDGEDYDEEYGSSFVSSDVNLEPSEVEEMTKEEI